ncbi:hypothetical protein CLOM_g17315 [Closterium sp. NIES-68]|nr:hypothetical protein CLOM_g17315 [Closterium sp. NIES-68]
MGRDVRAHGEADAEWGGAGRGVPRSKSTEVLRGLRAGCGGGLQGEDREDREGRRRVRGEEGEEGVEGRGEEEGGSVSGRRRGLQRSPSPERALEERREEVAGRGRGSTSGSSREHEPSSTRPSHPPRLPPAGDQHRRYRSTGDVFSDLGGADAHAPPACTPPLGTTPRSPSRPPDFPPRPGLAQGRGKSGREEEGGSESGDWRDGVGRASERARHSRCASVGVEGMGRREGGTHGDGEEGSEAEDDRWAGDGLRGVAAEMAASSHGRGGVRRGEVGAGGREQVSSGASGGGLVRHRSVNVASLLHRRAASDPTSPVTAAKPCTLKGRTDTPRTASPGRDGSNGLACPSLHDAAASPSTAASAAAPRARSPLPLPPFGPTSTTPAPPTAHASGRRLSPLPLHQSTNVARLLLDSHSPELLSPTRHSPTHARTAATPACALAALPPQRARRSSVDLDDLVRHGRARCPPDAQRSASAVGGHGRGGEDGDSCGGSSPGGGSGSGGGSGRGMRGSRGRAVQGAEGAEGGQRHRRSFSQAQSATGSAGGRGGAVAGQGHMRSSSSSHLMPPLHGSRGTAGRAEDREGSPLSRGGRGERSGRGEEGAELYGGDEEWGRGHAARGQGLRPVESVGGGSASKGGGGRLTRYRSADVASLLP